MILHILKKDLKFAWLAMAAIQALKLASAWAVLQMGIFADGPNLRLIQVVVNIGCLALTYFVIIRTLQNDPVVSDNGDWLIRPVNGRDMLLAKTLFALIVTAVPAFTVNFLFGLALGMPFGTCLTRSMLTAALAFLVLGLPALAVAAITATITQAVGVVVSVLVVWAFAMLARGILMHSLIGLDGDQWAVSLIQIAVVAGASSVVLALQYLRHQKRWAEGIFAGTVGILTTTIFMPEAMTVQLQRLLTSESADVPITVRLDTPAMRIRPPATETMGTPTLYVPLILTKNEGTIAKIDGVQLQLQSAEGKILFKRAVGIAENRGNANLTRMAFAPPSASSAATYLGVAIPLEDYVRLKGRMVRASLTYNVEAYQGSTPIQAILPLHQRRNISHVGICESRLSADSTTAIDLYCFAEEERASCTGASVRYPDTGTVVPLKIDCLHPSPLFYSGLTENVAAGHVVATYPAPAGNVPVEISITTYRVRNHVTQTVVLPLARLEDLALPLAR